MTYSDPQKKRDYDMRARFEAAAALEAQARRIEQLETQVAELEAKLYAATPWDGKDE